MLRIKIEPTENDPGTLVAARLLRSGFSSLRNVSCEYSEGTLTLLGTVPSFYLRQIAQELAAHTRGVRQVNNDLQVSVAPARDPRPTLS
jgi:osmotically-inducible protein OsmY